MKKSVDYLLISINDYDIIFKKRINPFLLRVYIQIM